MFIDDAATAPSTVFPPRFLQSLAIAQSSGCNRAILASLLPNETVHTCPRGTQRLGGHVLSFSVQEVCSPTYRCRGRVALEGLYLISCLAVLT